MQISSPLLKDTQFHAVSGGLRPPNLLLVGCQKAGTSWLHAALAKSHHFACSSPKELFFFGKPEAERDFAEYLTHFPDRPQARFVMESTPGYFKLPSNGHDTAASIRKCLGNPKLIVIFRNPVDRYESAYIHHLDKGRVPYVEKITTLTNDQRMLEFGHYGSILKHWKSVFPDLGVFFYDDLEADNMRFVRSVMDFLGVENDLSRKTINFRSNGRERKTRNMAVPPELDLATRAALRDYYRDEILLLQEQTGRDLSHWLHPDWKTGMTLHKIGRRLRRLPGSTLRRLQA